MLKIKDNVDLKELEKYGFKPINYINQRTHKYAAIMADKEINVITIGEDRVIHYNQMSVYSELDDIMFDLIKDDLIEKADWLEKVGDI